MFGLPILLLFIIKMVVIILINAVRGEPTSVYAKSHADYITVFFLPKTIRDLKIIGPQH